MGKYLEAVYNEMVKKGNLDKKRVSQYDLNKAFQNEQYRNIVYKALVSQGSLNPKMVSYQTFGKAITKNLRGVSYGTPNYLAAPKPADIGVSNIINKTRDRIFNDLQSTTSKLFGIDWIIVSNNNCVSVEPKTQDTNTSENNAALWLGISVPIVCVVVFVYFLRRHIKAEKSVKRQNGLSIEKVRQKFKMKRSVVMISLFFILDALISYIAWKTDSPLGYSFFHDYGITGVFDGAGSFHRVSSGEWMMVYLCHIPILSFCIVLGINVLMLISVVIDKIKGKEDK